MSPKKVRLVVDLVRGLRVDAAEERLAFLGQRPAEPVLKLLRSAIANALHNNHLKRSTLRIKEIRVDEGKTEHRWRPRAHGRAFPIRQRGSHVTIVLTGESEAHEVKADAPAVADGAGAQTAVTEGK